MMRVRIALTMDLVTMAMHSMVVWSLLMGIDMAVTSVLDLTLFLCCFLGCYITNFLALSCIIFSFVLIGLLLIGS